MTKVSYTINGVTTTSFAEAQAMGWNSYSDRPNYDDIIEPGRPENEKAMHRAKVDEYLLK